MFYSYILNEKQLTDNSFPKWMPDSDNETDSTKRLAFIPNFTKSQQTPMSKTSQSASQSKQQTTPRPADSTPGILTASSLVNNCKRCRSTFTLIQVGKLKRYSSTNSECVYHWGKLRSMRFDKSVEQRYSCCSGGLGSDGCEVGKHVYDGDYDGNGTGGKKF